MNKNFFIWLTRNVVILGLVSMLTDLSSQIVFPLIPLFLVSLWGGGTIIGVVEWAAETTASFLKVISGFLSDKFKKRKIFILIWYSFSTVTKPLFALAKTWPMVLIFRVIERIGKWLRDAPRDALLAESVDQRYLWKVYGFHRSMDGLGSVLGAILALVLFPLLGYQKLFLFAALPGILAVLAILFVEEWKNLKKELPASVTTNLDTSKNILKIGFIQSIRILPRHLVYFIGVAALFAFGDFGYAFLLLKTKSVWLTDSNAISFYVLFYLTYTICSTPAGILSDKFGRKKVLMVGYALFIIISLSLIRVSNMSWIIFFFVIYGIFFALVDGVQRAFVVDLCPKDLKATALGVFHTAIGIVALPAGYIIWVLRDKISPSAAFIFSAVIGTLSLILFLFLKKEKE